jgi:hypothetical protein
MRAFAFGEHALFCCGRSPAISLQKRGPALIIILRAQARILSSLPRRVKLARATIGGNDASALFERGWTTTQIDAFLKQEITTTERKDKTDRATIAAAFAHAAKVTEYNKGQELFSAEKRSYTVFLCSREAWTY